MLELKLKKSMKILNEANQIFLTMSMYDSDYVMNCTAAINSISNTLKNFLVTVRFTLILYSNHI